MQQQRVRAMRVDDELHLQIDERFLVEDSEMPVTLCEQRVTQQRPKIFLIHLLSQLSNSQEIIYICQSSFYLPWKALCAFGVSFPFMYVV